LFQTIASIDFAIFCGVLWESNDNNDWLIIFKNTIQSKHFCHVKVFSMLDHLRKRRGSKEGFKTYGTTSNYGTTSIQTNPTQKSYQSEPTDITPKETIKKFDIKTEYPTEPIPSSNDNGQVGTLKNNYYQQVRGQQKTEQPSTGKWIYDAIQDMLFYIYQTVVQASPIGFKTSGDFPEVEVGIDDMYM
jgi:hypothetical protein